MARPPLASWVASLPSLLQKAAQGGKATIVMGNEASDLDSGVSALCLAYHRSTPSRPVLPLLNIPSEDFPLKTELVWALEEQGVTTGHLLFRDSSPPPLSLPHLSLVLVDHNVLPHRDLHLEGSVEEVLDHHARETSLEEGVTIEPVGSCASLVLRTILSEDPTFCEPSCLALLRQTILLDTVCLRPEARRVTPTDVAMVERVEAILGLQAAAREQVFNRVQEEKGRVGHLTVLQLLGRDLKVVVSPTGSSVALSSLPLPCSSFLHLPGWADQVEAFIKKGPYSCMVVLGSQPVPGEGVTRDLLVGGALQGGSEQVVEEVRRGLEEAVEPGLGLTLSRDSPAAILGFRHYRQGNSAASRKQILPLVKQAVAGC